MSWLSRFVRRTFVPALAVVGLGLSFAPAASATPQLDWMDCQSGASRYVCGVHYTGAVGPVTHRWEFYWRGNHVGTQHTSTAVGNCLANQPYNVYVYVTDSTGQAQSSLVFVCNPGDWN